MSSVAEKQKPIASQEIKEVSEQKEKKIEIQIDNNEKTLGIVLASLWLIISAYFIFHDLDERASIAFQQASLPAGLIGAGLIITRIVKWKRMTATEMLLFAAGLFICLFPLMGKYFDSKEYSTGILLLLIYNVGFLVLVIKKLKEFNLADMILASIQILYLSSIFFYTIFYVSFKPEYGDNDTANIIGLMIGLAVAIVWIILMRKNWIALKRK